MKILLFGVSNVGKSTTGRILAELLHVPYFDLDDEIKKTYGITLEEFVHWGTIEQRDQKRGMLIKRIVTENESCVIAITPMSYRQYFEEILKMENVIAFELIDTPENIFDRLVFSDEEDNIYKDDEYKNKLKNFYMEDIAEDLKWYGKVYEIIHNKVMVNNDSPKKVADKVKKMLEEKGKEI